MLFFYLPCFLFAFSKGYHTFTVTRKTPFNIRLSKNALFFIFDEPPSSAIQFVTIDSANNSHQIPMNSLSHVMIFDTVLFVSTTKNVQYTLHYWLVPNNLCSGVSHSITADRLLSFEMKSAKIPSDFCVFSQSSSSSYSTDLIYLTDSNKEQISFYTYPTKPDLTCQKGKKCSFSSSSPFFIRFSDIAGHKFASSLVYKVRRNTLESFDCGFKAIPFMVDSNLQMQAGNLDVQNTRCLSSAEDALSNITLIAAGAIVAAMIILLLHCSGIINLKAIMGCQKEKERFNKLKENPYASQLQKEEIETKATEETL